MKSITQTDFGEVNGQKIIETTMINRNGLRVSSCNYGATITKISTADRQGNFENIVCSFPSVDGYIANPQYFGATIGPFAGRLENALIQIDEECIQIPPNEGQHLLHGGADGFHQVIWQVKMAENQASVSTIYELIYHGNYPGEIIMTVNMILNDEDELLIYYEGSSNENTLLNCTNHTYFNLSGDLKRTVHEQQLKIPAESYIPINEIGLPLGEFRSVNDTPFDFKKAKSLSETINMSDEQIHFASGGLDHPLLLTSDEIELYDAKSGRKLTIVTEDPCVVVYTGNKIGDDFDFTEARAQNFLGVCLEVQNLPNSSKYPHFPSAILRKNEVYQKKTIYRFSKEPHDTI